MVKRIFNFSPGPAALPLPVLEKAQEDLLNFQNTGMSVMEMSHRSKEIEEMISETERLTNELLNLGDNFRVLFLQGGATTQFSMVPLNFLPEGRTADYIITGSFAEKAYKDAVKVGNIHVAGSSEDTDHNRIMSLDEINLSSSPEYVHITSNNTIYGTQWQTLPNFGDIPLVADMSSDIMSYPFDVSNFGLIYAGAQKNLGPAGVTVAIVRKDMFDKVPDHLPSMQRYDLLAEKNSLLNTPPCFNIYIVNLVLQWIKDNGGLEAINKHNKEKASYVYQAIDNSDGFYLGHAQKESRSLMNVTFRLQTEELEKKFIKEAKEEGLVGLKGHRSVGGIRASIYNAMTKEGCMKLAEFMEDFQKKN